MARTYSNLDFVGTASDTSSDIPSDIASDVASGVARDKHRAQGPAGIWRGVVGTDLVGLYGRPFLALDDALAAVDVDLSSLRAVHDEVCVAYASMPVDYTGGSHRSMQIMPASRSAEALVDYVEVVRGLDDNDWACFVRLADDPADFAGVAVSDRADIGEERQLPLSRRQMLWLKVRHGVYFPWKGYLELLPNHRWKDKASATGKQFSRAARQFLPTTLAFLQTLPFASIGRCNIMGLEANDHGTVHHDGEHDDRGDDDDAEEFITLYPVDNKQLFLWDEVNRREHVVSGARAVWFNDFDDHGVSAAPFFRYSIRVDGVFTDAFRRLLQERYA